jgi:4-diphosphocytidyl-2C-methyl-D-erythritol kinase
MTGSGSGVFGLFPDAAGAEEARAVLREAGVVCYTAQTTPKLD